MSLFGISHPSTLLNMISMRILETDGILNSGGKSYYFKYTLKDSIQPEKVDLYWKCTLIGLVQLPSVAIAALSGFFLMTISVNPLLPIVGIIAAVVWFVLGHDLIQYQINKSYIEKNRDELTARADNLFKFGSQIKINFNVQGITKFQSNILKNLYDIEDINASNITPFCQEPNDPKCKYQMVVEENKVLLPTEQSELKNNKTIESFLRYSWSDKEAIREHILEAFFGMYNCPALARY